MTTFSVLLGLVDFINPILYTCFFVCMIRNLKGKSKPLYFRLFLVGAIITITGGFIIPTGKVIVGLGVIPFTMPVSIVCIVNIGLFISGATLFLTTLKKNYSRNAYSAAALPGLKFNTVAVLLGAAGIIMIYISLIKTAIRKNRKLPIVFAALSFTLTVFLSFVGIKADLYNPVTHWIIEITNICCQASLVACAETTFKSGEK